MQKLCVTLFAFTTAVTLGTAQAAEQDSTVTSKQARPDPCAAPKRDAKKPSTKPAPAKQPATQSKPR